MSTRRTPVPNETTPRIDAVIDVAGNFTGQLAIGQSIVQIQVQPGGALVAAPSGPVEVRRRQPPVRVRGRRPRIFVDRVDERAAGRQAALRHDVLAFTGPPGSGKSALLRELAYELTEGDENREVVLVAGAGRPVDDVLNDAFQLLHETDRPYVALGAALRAHLQPFDGLVLIDDAVPGSRELTDLVDAFPDAAVLMSGPQFSGDLPSMRLTSLPEQERRSLVGLLGAGSEAIAASPSGLPGDLVLAARRLAAEPARDEDLTPAWPQDEAERLALAVLLAAGPAGLTRTLLAAATGSSNAADHLAARGLAEESDEGGLDTIIRVAAVLSGGSEDTPAGVYGLRRLLGAVAAEPADGGPVRPTHDLTASAGAVLKAARRGLWAEVAAAGPVVEARLLMSGRWSEWSEVLNATLLAAQEQGDSRLEAHALHQLGTWALCTGDLVSSRAWLTRAYDLRRSIGDEGGLEITEANLAWLPTEADPGDGPQSQPRAGSGPMRWHGGLWLGAVLAVTVTAIGVGTAVRSAQGEPRLSAPSAVLDLGEVALGTEARASISVRNLGDARAESVTVDAEPAGFSAATRCADIEPAKACRLAVRFSPTAVGAQSGRVKVLLDGSPAADVRVRGVGVLPPSHSGVTARPEVVRFGRQAVGTASEPVRVEVLVANGVRLGELTIAGASPEQFTLVRNGCSQHRGSGICAIAVVFSPTADGHSVATVTLPVTGREPAEVPLLGDGVAANASVRLDPPIVDFGRVSVGDTMKATLEVRNGRSSSTTIVNRLLIGSTAGDFTIDGCTQAVPAGAGCPLTVRFSPSKVGQRVGELTIRLSAGRQLTALLVGEGIATADTEPPRLSVTSLTAEASSAKGAVVSYRATAQDEVDGELLPVCDRRSGDTFPLGPTTVSCMATDVAGNTASKSFVVRVVDTTPPDLTVPKDITRYVDPESPSVRIEWLASAADLVDAKTQVSCDPSSGSSFRATGTESSPGPPHKVTCTARDRSGNSRSDTFQVQVLTYVYQ